MNDNTKESGEMGDGKHSKQDPGRMNEYPQLSHQLVFFFFTIGTGKDNGSIQTETATKEILFMMPGMVVVLIHGRMEMCTEETFLRINGRARCVFMYPK